MLQGGGKQLQATHPSAPFFGVRFVLFGFNPSHHEQVKSKLVSFGGVDTGHYGPECTHVIVHNLIYDDPVCVTAIRDGKTLVTSSWLDKSLEIGEPVETTHIMYRPPKDLNGIPGAKELVMCLTGYQRHERDDIMASVGLMGAHFSKPLVANRVTHLICYKFEGEKYDLAKRMKKIKLVNHLWVEECLKAWKILPEDQYSKSGYELEMMEAEAKDSVEDAIDFVQNPSEGRNVDANLHLQNDNLEAQDHLRTSTKVSSPSKQQELPHDVSVSYVMLPVKEEKKSDPASTSRRINQVDEHSPMHHRKCQMNVQDQNTGFPPSGHIENDHQVISGTAKTSGDSKAEDFSSLSFRKTPTRKSDPTLLVGDNLGNVSEASSKKLTGSDIGKHNASGKIKSPSSSLSFQTAGKLDSSDGRVSRNFGETITDCISILEPDKEKGASVSVRVGSSKQSCDSKSGKSGPSSSTKPTRRSSFLLQTAETVRNTDRELEENLAEISADARTFNIEQDKEAASVCIAASSVGIDLLNEEGSGSQLPQKRKVDDKLNFSPLTPMSQKLASSGSKRIDATEPKTRVSTVKKTKRNSLNQGDNTAKSSSGHKPSPHVSSVKSISKSASASTNLAAEILQGRKSMNMTATTSLGTSNASKPTELVIGTETAAEAQHQQQKAISFSEAKNLEFSKSASPKQNSDDQIGNSISKPSRRKTVARKTLGARAKLSNKTVVSHKGSVSGKNSLKHDAPSHSISQMEENHSKSSSSSILPGDLGSNPFHKSSNAINVDAGLLDDETEPPPELDVDNENFTGEHAVETRTREGSGMPLGHTDEADVTASPSERYREGMAGAKTGDAKHQKCVTWKKGFSGRPMRTAVLTAKEMPNYVGEAGYGKSGEDAIEKELNECGTLLSNKSKGTLEVEEKTEPVGSNVQGTSKSGKQTRKLAGTKRRGTLLLNKPEGAIEVETEIEPDLVNGIDKGDKGKHIGKLAVKSDLTKGRVETEKENDPIVSNDQGKSKRTKLSRKLGGKKRRGTLVLNTPEVLVEGEKNNENSSNDAEGKRNSEEWSETLVGKSNQMVRNSNEMTVKKNLSNNQLDLSAVRHESARFLLSGHKLQRKEFQQIIKRLKGKLCRDSHQWSYQATHLIIPDPLRRTEKFFAAAASGRWILKCDYLTASSQAGKLLPEEPYEWHKNGLSEDGAINLEAPRKWRQLRDKTGHGAFYGMRIVIYGECIAPPLETLKRVVKGGDGIILATSPPYSRFLEAGVDFALVSPGIPRADIWVQEFLRHEIPCVSADYLVEYVCKPAYSLERHIQYNTHEWASKSHSKLLSLSEEIVTETNATTPDNQEATDDLACQVCGSTDRGEVMLICGDESGCHGCGLGMHIDCVNPPLENVPEEDWFCPKCMESRKKPSESTKKKRLLKSKR